MLSLLHLLVFQVRLLPFTSRIEVVGVDDVVAGSGCRFKHLVRLVVVRLQKVLKIEVFCSLTLLLRKALGRAGRQVHFEARLRAHIVSPALLAVTTVRVFVVFPDARQTPAKTRLGTVVDLNVVSAVKSLALIKRSDRGLTAGNQRWLLLGPMRAKISKSVASSGSLTCEYTLERTWHRLLIFTFRRVAVFRDVDKRPVWRTELRSAIQFFKPARMRQFLADRPAIHLFSTAKLLFDGLARPLPLATFFQRVCLTVRSDGASNARKVKPEDLFVKL